MDPMIGQKLGSFLVETQLGIGAMGVVYKATSDKGKVAAVKVMSSELATKGNAGDRFKRESEILKQIRHPNIVQLLAIGRSKGKDYFAMEFIDGHTLEEVLDKKGPIPWADVVEVCAQLCDALHHAHEKGIIHRDLKPSNLMRTSDGKLKLTDFGIAKDLEADALTGTGRTLGTAAYMAPEQIRGTPTVSARTDLYALGIVMYQMLTGHCPFQGKSAMILMHCHLTEPPPRISGRIPEIPRPLDDLVFQLMAKDPVDRPWDAQAVATKLRGIQKKAATGKLVKTFDAPDHPERMGTAPTQLATGFGAAPSKAVAKKGKKRAARNTDLDGAPPDRQWIGTALLIGALVGLLGFTGYMLFWPASKADLMRRAGELMASTNSADWSRAREDYFDEIERRFPEERDQVGAWRDQIGQERVARRAGILERPNMLAGSKPSGEAEALYVSTYTIAADAEKDGDLEAIAEEWRAMAKTLAGSKDDIDRHWSQHAAKKADEVVARMADERTTASRMLAEADEKERAEDPRAAASIRNAARKRFGKAKHLADLFTAEPAPAGDPR